MSERMIERRGNILDLSTERNEGVASGSVEQRSTGGIYKCIPKEMVGTAGTEVRISVGRGPTEIPVRAEMSVGRGRAEISVGRGPTEVWVGRGRIEERTEWMPEAMEES